MKRALLIAAILAGCGGSSSTAPASTEPSGPRPVRIDDPGATGEASAPARPVRLAPTVPGEVPESDDLADPPPVEPPNP